MNDHAVAAFQEIVWRHYDARGRHDLPWRQPDPDGTFDPYKIAVSEIMLQQTQVPRVIPKFKQFLQAFPAAKDLAAASLGEVLKAWNGLGYNRRAKFLWQTAQVIMQEYGGQMPETREELVRLPGIGANTAGAILVYAFDRPEVFIETNIRTVFIHHFFADQDKVADKEIQQIAAVTLPKSHYRQWYWALMDYGTFLKQTAGNTSRRSAHYTKQSRFEGSRRQIRGQVLRLLAGGPHTKTQLVKQISDERLAAVLADLEQEGFIRQTGGTFTLC